MSQRLAKHAVLADGRLIRILMGADPSNDDPNNQGGTGTGDNGGAGDGGTGDDGSSDDGGSQGVTPEELQRMRNRMVAADRRASQLDAQLREYQDRDKTDSQRLQGQVETLTTENEQLKKDIAASRRDNAFLKSNGVTWHDAEVALSKIQWDIVTKDDGEVDLGLLKKEIDRVAKAAPYLVKTAQSGNSDGGGISSGGSTRQQGASGHHPGNSSGQATGSAADRAALEKKYPALRR
jgi:hypothetical protein